MTHPELYEVNKLNGKKTSKSDWSFRSPLRNLSRNNRCKIPHFEDFVRNDMT